jgi:exodeoxyribonuclease X
LVSASACTSGAAMTTYVFDTECTDRKQPLEIIEAAWLRITPEEDLAGASDRIPTTFNAKPWSQRYKPNTPSTLGATAVHHILPHELEGMPPSASFALPADCTYLVGHSISFDFEAIGSPPNIKLICTHAMAQWVWPDATGYSQVALMYLIHGATEATREMVKAAHGALADVHMNAGLLRAILDMRPEIKTWADLYAFSEECRIPRTCPMKKYEGVLLEELDDGFIRWCLNQYWLDSYFRKGLERVIEKRNGRQSMFEDDPDFREVDEN